MRFEPERRLIHTHWSPASGTSDADAHYQRVSWELRERDGATELTVSETNLMSIEAKAMSERTWPVVLSNLKAVVEEASTSPAP